MVQTGAGAMVPVGGRRVWVDVLGAAALPFLVQAALVIWARENRTGGGLSLLVLGIPVSVGFAFVVRALRWRACVFAFIYIPVVLAALFYFTLAMTGLLYDAYL